MSDSLPSTKPYFVRALYEWCSDNGFTPYLHVRVNEQTRVPRQHIREGEIVLNISMDATGSLQMDNETVEFMARFSGVLEKIYVPMSQVVAIYARENGAGMMFEVEETTAAKANSVTNTESGHSSASTEKSSDPVSSDNTTDSRSSESAQSAPQSSSKPAKARSHLQRIK